MINQLLCITSCKPLYLNEVSLWKKVCKKVKTKVFCDRINNIGGAPVRCRWYSTVKVQTRQRPSVPCHHIREYRYAFGAVEPLSGESFFLTMPNCDTECTNIFLEKLSEQYPDDIILLVCDGAAWHKSKALRCPENIQLLSIPPYTPEMNPIEQIWKQIRSMGFRNEVFDSLSAVMDRLCETICLLTTDMVKSITGRQWIIECF